MSNSGVVGAVFERAQSVRDKTIEKGRPLDHAFMIVSKNEWVEWVVAFRPTDLENVRAYGVRLIAH